MKKTTLNPIWNETFAFPYSRGPDDSQPPSLVIECEDVDTITAADFMGLIRVELDPLKDHKRLKKWLPLQARSDDKASSNISGDLEVFVRWWSVWKSNSRRPESHRLSSTQCGLPEVQAAQRPDEQRCVVYSFGSRGDDLFERRVLQLAPGCEVHIFDRSAPVRPAPRGGSGPYARTARYHCRYLTADNASSLSTYMRQLGHDYLDVLKVDIEGTEWDVFPGIDWPRARIGQIQVEIQVQTTVQLQKPPFLFYMFKNQKIFQEVQEMSS